MSFSTLSLSAHKDCFRTFRTLGVTRYNGYQNSRRTTWRRPSPDVETSARRARGELHHDGASALQRRGALSAASIPGEYPARGYYVCKYRVAFSPRAVPQECSRRVPLLDKLDRPCQSAVSHKGSLRTSDHSF